MTWCRIRFLLPLLALSACDQQMENMPRYESYEASPLFPDGTTALPPVPGTVAREADLAPPPSALPQPLTATMLDHGRQRFDALCSPCHSRTGDGDGTVVQRGFPRPPSFHQPALRGAPDRHFYDVITFGYGAMYSYADRVPRADRWAIVGYIRALQLSRHIEVDRLPATDRQALEDQP